jgi:two-component system, NarL family, sensor histidine kinase UhpB
MEIVKSTNDIADLYTEALEHYLSGGGERALRAAYEAGRLALAGEVGLLDIAELHHAALCKMLPDGPGQAALSGRLSDASQFLAESLSAYEMAYRGYRDAISGLRRVNEALEQEVKRIAHAIHDEAGQLLVVVHLALADISRELPSAMQGKMNDVAVLLRQVEEQLRSLSHGLRPTILDDLGLVPAIRFLAEGVSKRFGLLIQVDSRLDLRLPAAIETALYRIIQEALNNITRHAAARNVWIALDRNAKKIDCSIRDNGVGFNVPTRCQERGNRGLGLIGIQERLIAIGGTLHIESEPGSGTQLVITIPRESSNANSLGIS